MLATSALTDPLVIRYAAIGLSVELKADGLLLPEILLRRATGIIGRRFAVKREASVRASGV